MARSVEKRIETSVETLQRDIDRIMQDYDAHVVESTNEAITALAQKGKNAVKRFARIHISRKRRKYVNGWRYKTQGMRKRASAYTITVGSAVIYQKQQPSLVHLLEHGHATPNGGRTRPRPHLKPVSDQIADEITKRIVRNL